MKTKIQTQDLTQGPLGRQLIAFTLPLVLANLLQTLYTLVDLAVVGHFAGSGALAAVSVSGQITIFFTLVGTSFASGGQIYVAQLVGHQRRGELGAAIGTILSFVLLCSLVFAALGVGLCDTALGWLNTPAEALDDAADYLRICSVGLIFLFGYNAVCAALRGMGESKAPTWFIAVSAAVNVVGDLLLVAVFDMGAAGAAIATAVSQAAAFALSLWYLLRRSSPDTFEFKLRDLRIEGERLRVMVKLALPLVLMQVSIHLSMLYISAYINDFGTAAASLSGVGNKLNSVMTMVSGAFGTAMATVVGQNIGAGKIDRIRRSIRITTLINLAVFALIAVVVLVFPRAVFAIFTSDAEILDLAPQYLRIAVWSYLFFSLMSPSNGLINGVGNTMLNLGISIMDGVVARVGLSLLLGHIYGMWGYFAGYCLAGVVSVILGWLYVWSGKWTEHKLLK